MNSQSTLILGGSDPLKPDMDLSHGAAELVFYSGLVISLSRFSFTFTAASSSQLHIKRGKILSLGPSTIGTTTPLLYFYYLTTARVNWNLCLLRRKLTVDSKHDPRARGQVRITVILT